MAEAIDLTDDADATCPLKLQLEAVEDELDETEREISRLLERQSQLRSQKESLQRALLAEQRAPRADWAASSFPWDAKAMQLLQSIFKINSFRPLQQEVINATLQGRDVLCLMPSGGGKSLCYQLPALVSEGVTLVVSPLLSLIQDQVAGLRAVGVAAASLTSVTSKEEATGVMRELEGGGVRLLYCTPEKVINSKRFMSKLEKVYKAGKLARIAIDEAHCCSQWGNDFRPDYKKLGVLKQQFPTTPTIALTATATHQVCEDLRTTLRLEGCEFFRSSINRPNLHYEVRPKPLAAQDLGPHIASYISTTYPSGESGIVYCLTRKDTEAVAEQLRGAGLQAVAYHADMDPAVREGAHSAWSSGAVQVIVATIAFGMGINKPDVRFVLHHCLSKSVENYYQESGRAGRDGLPARCILYYRFADALRLAGVVCYEAGWQSHLMAMLQYAAGCGRCRRAALQGHFSEAPAECRAACDVCAAAAEAAAAGVAVEARAPSGAAGAADSTVGAGAGARGGAAEEDVTETAKQLLTTIQSFESKGKKCTLVMLLDAWAKGGRSRELGERVGALLALRALLAFDFGITAYATNVYLKLTSLGVGLLEGAGGRQPLMLPIPPEMRGGATGSAGAGPSSRGVRPTAGGAAAAAANGSGKKGARGATAGKQSRPATGAKLPVATGRPGAGGPTGVSARRGGASGAVGTGCAGGAGGIGGAGGTGGTGRVLQVGESESEQEGGDDHAGGGGGGGGGDDDDDDDDDDEEWMERPLSKRNRTGGH